MAGGGGSGGVGVRGGFKDTGAYRQQCQKNKLPDHQRHDLHSRIPRTLVSKGLCWALALHCEHDLAPVSWGLWFDLSFLGLFFGVKLNDTHQNTDENFLVKLASFLTSCHKMT